MAAIEASRRVKKYKKKQKREKAREARRVKSESVFSQDKMETVF